MRKTREPLKNFLPPLFGWSGPKAPSWTVVYWSILCVLGKSYHWNSRRVRIFLSSPLNLGVEGQERQKGIVYLVPYSQGLQFFRGDAGSHPCPLVLLWELRRLDSGRPFQDIVKADSALGLWGSCPYTYLCTDYSWEVLVGKHSTVLLVDRPLTRSTFLGVHGYDISVQDDPEKQCEMILSINKQVEAHSRAWKSQALQTFFPQPCHFYICCPPTKFGVLFPDPQGIIFVLVLLKVWIKAFVCFRSKVSNLFLFLTRHTFVQ